MSDELKNKIAVAVFMQSQKNSAHTYAKALHFETLEDLADVVLSALHGTKLWLWKNGDTEHLAFDNPYPSNYLNGDPSVLGEPCGHAIFKNSVNGRPYRVRRGIYE